MSDSNEIPYFQRPYKFSLKLASILTSFSMLMVLTVDYFDGDVFHIKSTIIQSILFFSASFFIIRFRVEKYIYRKINLIYDSVSILDVKDVDKKNITTDLETLSKEVIKFAETKSLEIETLRAQETFRREFIGNLAHELKTPLFTVQGYIETLIDGASEEPELLEKYLDRANNGVQRLINIAKDLDLITKLETGNLGLENNVFSIDELAKATIDLLEIKSKTKGMSLHLESKILTPVMVSGDKEKIGQVLMNLISNSIKYGEENGLTIITIKYKYDKILTSVKDNGEGIKKIHLNRIFERFYRIDRHRSREEGGSGLGLSIVKHILEAHGEKIYVESEYTKGSTFSFSLPEYKNKN
ncbi:MAG: sensor histidine kinase [Flavobacteriales bacterium]|nr:sensor histidine kinase [Flavobacteriales bacterium]